MQIVWSFSMEIFCSEHYSNAFANGNHNRRSVCGGLFHVWKAICRYVRLQRQCSRYGIGRVSILRRYISVHGIWLAAPDTEVLTTMVSVGLITKHKKMLEISWITDRYLIYIEISEKMDIWKLISVFH